MTDFKLVPVVPTSEMLAAGEYALEFGCYASGIYADMLAAAPVLGPRTVDTLSTDSNSEQEQFSVINMSTAAPQPAQAVTQLVEALKAAQKEAVYGLNHARTDLQASAALGRVSAIVGAALAAYCKQEEEK